MRYTEAVRWAQILLSNKMVYQGIKMIMPLNVTHFARADNDKAIHSERFACTWPG